MRRSRGCSENPRRNRQNFVSSSETGYRIERKTTAAGAYAQVAQVGANVHSYSDVNGLAPKTRYYYRVRATNGTMDSAYSNEGFAVTLP